MTTSPTLDAFLSTARHEFSFLVSEFGFTEQPDSSAYPNPFSVHYATSTTAVTVEGVQWGVGVQVSLSHLPPIPGFLPYVPLWAIVELRAPNKGTPVSGQLQKLARDAHLLRVHAVDFLRGDFSSFEAAMSIIEREAAEAAKPKKRKLP